MTLDIGHDMSLADGSETVTVTLKRAGGETAIEVAGALRRALGQPHQLFGGIALEGNEVVWNVPASPLGGDDLRRGDTITDAQAIAWTILAAAKLTLGTRWRCICRKEQ